MLAALTLIPGNAIIGDMQNYGSFLTGKLQPETYANISIEPDRMDVHWQTMRDGKQIIALSFGRLGIQLAPVDAITLADMLERTVHDFRVTMDALESAEYELQAGLRQSYEASA